MRLYSFVLCRRFLLSALRDKVGLLTKPLKFNMYQFKGKKKDAFPRQIRLFIILFRFKAVAERRQ